MSFHKKRSAADPPLSAEAARQRALRLLARREHSQRQLQQKLSASGVMAEAATTLITELADDGLQSDERFGLALVRSRIAQGYGPLRITAELTMAGLGRDAAAALIDSLSPDWTALCSAARNRRCGEHASNAAERARQWRSLAQKGFEARQIQAVLQAHGVDYPETLADDGCI